MEEDLLLKFIEGKASPKEQREIVEWIEQNEENKKIFAQLKNLSVASEILSEEQRERDLIQRQRLRMIYSWSLKIASILIIAFSCFYFGKKHEYTNWIETSELKNSVISVPLGESVCLTLPDGSTVSLNSGSTLKYTGLYGINEREVYLDGEGYFKIKKGEKKFIVKTDIINVEVVGTEFNLSAYNEDRQISTSLFSGKVEIKNLTKSEDIILEPNYCYTFDKITKKTIVKNITRRQTWTENYFVAESDDIISFVKKIERKYKVKIIVSPELSEKCIYTGTFKGESLIDILNNMSLASPISYEIKNDSTVIINPRK
ncbi:MAG TPA: FecR family protein [Bacteroidales bacterium]|jgi:ferric-dicitrate binding protein FerR (iron transport regulator)|nr:FecR family protein [Bacteroidales bacterium]HON54190.1 FecR family protein [Bacteroidales bacterium]HRT33040.1 FecR family protein [Bacteroidales bacterium]HRT83353.1 FecR family protein [Bacteroidales bacterium]